MLSAFYFYLYRQTAVSIFHMRECHTQHRRKMKYVKHKNHTSDVTKQTTYAELAIQCMELCDLLGPRSFAVGYRRIQRINMARNSKGLRAIVLGVCALVDSVLFDAVGRCIEASILSNSPPTSLLANVKNITWRPHDGRMAYQIRIPDSHKTFSCGHLMTKRQVALQRICACSPLLLVYHADEPDRAVNIDACTEPTSPNALFYSSHLHG